MAQAIPPGTTTSALSRHTQVAGSAQGPTTRWQPGERAAQRGYPFSPVLETPSMTNRWANENSTSTGTLAITAPAMRMS